MRIDFHAHILPGVDHGSTSIESSTEQLKRAKAVGIELIVATPHFYPDQTRLLPFLERRNAAYEELKPILNELEIKSRLGAEVALCEGLENLEGIEKLCIEGTSVMLLEMPFREINKRLLDTICELQALGITPVLAHINRYSRSAVMRALELGVSAQLNAEAYEKFMSRRRYINCVDDNVVQALGSDAHEDRKKSYDEFERALDILGEKREKILMQRTAKLLNID